MFQYFKKTIGRGKQSLRIGLVAASAPTRKIVGDLSSGEAGLAVQQVDGTQVTAKAQGPDVNVFVYDLESSNPAAVAEFDRFMKERPAAVPVIVLSAALDEELVRWFLRLRVADWVKTPFAPGELIAACGRVLGQSKSTKNDVKCMAFVGAKGGAGTTTVAINAAVAIQARGKGQTTCLVDLDFLNSSCADYLDLAPRWAIDDLASDPSRLDPHLFASMLSPHKSGVAVLSGQRKFGDRIDFSEEVITRPLDFALQKFSHLVIDVPRTATLWAENVIQGATSLFIVTEFTVPGLKASRRLVNQLVEQHGRDIEPKVIVNRYARDFFGSNLAATEAKELLGPFLAGFVGNAPKIVNEAINRGVPTTEIKKRNSVYTDVSKIIAGVA
jgi:pilus assembly protein CpaE